MARVSSAPASPPSSGVGPWRSRLAAAVPAAVVVAAGLFAWWGVWAFEFKFDDHPAIDDNEAMRAGDWWQAAFGAQHSPLSNRPFPCWSLALWFSWLGFGSVSPHLGNLVLHLVNGVVLLWLLRAVLLAKNLAGQFAPATATRLSLLIASLWVVHPLATDSVAYATQRSTLLASLCLLLSLLATLRAAAGVRPVGYHTAAVATMALGMASKEEMVVGPLLVVLFQRAFLLPDWRSLRAQWPFHAALAATWGVLGVCVALGPPNQTVGYSTWLGTTAWQWLLTQAGVVAHYVRLALWPSPLRGAYSNGIVTELGPAVLPGLVVVALLAVAIWLWRRHQHWGWLGALFFLWLAPTSTVLPIITEIAAERRLYLPMLGVLVPVVFAVRAGLRRLSAGVARRVGAALALAAGLGLATMARRHAEHYATEPAFWQHAFDHRDPESRSMLAAQILSNHGSMLFRAGRLDEAHALFDLAMQCESPTYVERTHWAASLQQRGRHAEAVAALEQAIAQSPNYAESHGTLGTCLLMEFDRGGQGPADPRLVRAIACLARATELAPRRVAFWNSLGAAYDRQQQPAAAAAAFARATELPYERIEPFVSYADVLRRLGRREEAEAMWQRLRIARPRDVELRIHMARVAMGNNDRAQTMVLLREILAIEPGHQAAAISLRELEAQDGR